MLTKIRTLASLYRDLGLRWSVFRLAYAFRFRSGLIRLQTPKGEWDDYKNHVNVGAVAKHPRPNLQIPKELPETIPWNKQTAIAEADRLLKGEVKYFSHRFIQAEFPPNWHHDYFSSHVILPALVPQAQVRDSASSPKREGSLPMQSEILRFAQNDTTKHWSQISHDSSTDIKFIWEPNRFAFVYTLVRAYAASRDEKYAEAFWALIEDWAEHNPPNTGPNWMDGQEISLRLMAWTFGYDHFLNSRSTTPQRKENFLLYVAAQAERIFKNFGYAISTKSNHTISEAFGLWLAGLLFPELKDSKKYFLLGRQILEQEAASQIFPDGSYAMYSLNYHRFILHIYLYAIRLGEVNIFSFSDQLKNSITKSIEYLSQLIDPKTGKMPVYGSNDGALVLPLNNCDFTDYRPLLQLGWHILKKDRLFEAGDWDEDIFWLCGEIPPVGGGKKNKSPRCDSFPDGGVYLLHGINSQAVIRCTDFRSRPSHADQLHVDISIHGQEIAIDAGTYLYSGEGIWRNGLAHASAHNTVTVDNKDQMKMVSRFTWTNWSKGKVLRHDKDIWQGEHDGYKPVTHKRTVMSLESDRWLVIDKLMANESHHYALHWLIADFGIQKLASGYGLLLSQLTSKLVDSKVLIQMGLLGGRGDFSVTRADANSTRGWRSRYYGHKEPAISVLLKADQPQVTFWTFFGVEGDLIEVVGNVLKINSQEIEL